MSERGRRRSRQRARGLYTIALGVAALAGCRGSEARRLEAEVAGLAQAIDALRNAPNQGKPAFLAALSEKSCQSPEACQLKAGCVQAYERHLAAIAASERARALLGDKDGGTREVIAAATELNRAEHELAEAHTLTEQCSSKQGELLRKVRAR
ncbi:MAG TPA: hypothetical protein VG937_37495 [Polyangiaceae bacterium]|nr:hypothetical protein [Polyangiaceae bacterium]